MYTSSSSIRVVSIGGRYGILTCALKMASSASIASYSSSIISVYITVALQSPSSAAASSRITWLVGVGSGMETAL